VPLPEDLKGSRWAKRIGRVIFPWLIWCAKNSQTLFYSELDTEVVRRGIHHHVNFVMYGHPAGTVGNALLEMGEEFGEEIPPLNALVVAKTGPEAGLPSKGCDVFLEKFLGKKIPFKRLSVEDKRAIVEEVHEAIFRYPHWDDVQNYFRDAEGRYPELAPFDGRFLAVTRFSEKRPGRIAQDVPWDFAPKPGFQEPKKPESPEHKAPKLYIAAHPEVIGLPKGSKFELEKTLGSGDRADVCFSIKDKLVIAEIKSERSPEDDICKGVFQCIKYRAVIRAHQKLKRVIPNGEAVLVVGKKMSAEAKQLAEGLAVKFFDGIEVRVRDSS
jgi:hypothetical protein